MNSWYEYPALQLSSPVLALASGYGTVWAGGVGGVARYKTNWQLQNASLPLSLVTALCYAGGWLLAGGPEGFARSSDDGDNWQLAHISGTPFPVAVIMASPRFTNDATALAGTVGGGVLRTENAGRTWKPSNFGMQNFEVLGLTWKSGDIVLAATSDGIYRSPNGGRAWKATQGAESLSIAAITFLPDGSALAALENGGLLCSTDAGSSWTDFHNNLPQDAQPTLLDVIEDGTIILSTLEHGTFRSKDRGNAWEVFTPESALTSSVDGQKAYIGLPDGIMLLEQESITRLPSPPLHDLRYLLVANHKIFMAGLHSGLWVWTEINGWEKLSEATSMITSLAAAPDGALVMSGPEGMFHSTDDGKSWQVTLPGEDGLAAHITFRSDNSGWAGRADGSRLFLTDNGGLSWKPLKASFGVLPLVALQAASKLVFAATYNYSRQIAQIWYSKDDGLTWKRGAEVKTNWPVVSTNDQPPLITLGGIMFVLQPDGTWLQHRVGPAGSGIRRVVSDGNTMLAFTTAAILRSKDQGASWSVEQAIPSLSDILDIILAEDKLYLLLTEGRVWSRPL